MMTPLDSRTPSSRRSFLQTMAGATALAVGGSALAGSATADLPIIDTHQHLWDLSKVQLPWLKGAPDVLSHTYGLDEYRKATEGLNVVQAVYMEVDVRPEDQVKEAELLLEICRSKKAPTVAAVISGRPGSEGFEAYARRFAKNPEIKGIRRVLHSPETPKGTCLDPAFVKSIQLLGDLNMSFDLCMRPEELKDAAKLVKQCPGTRFILDHCGNGSPDAFLPEDKQSKKPSHTAEDWKADIAALAACDNVICKISGVIASAPKGIPFVDSLAPLVNHCLDRFGKDRVIFGGDWPVCLLGASYKEWVTTLKSLVASRPEQEQRQLFAENARKFYGLSK